MSFYWKSSPFQIISHDKATLLFPCVCGCNIFLLSLVCILVHCPCNPSARTTNLRIKGLDSLPIPSSLANFLFSLSKFCSWFYHARLTVTLQARRRQVILQQLHLCYNKNPSKEALCPRQCPLFRIILV